MERNFVWVQNENLRVVLKDGSAELYYRDELLCVAAPGSDGFPRRKQGWDGFIEYYGGVCLFKVDLHRSKPPERVYAEVDDESKRTGDDGSHLGTFGSDVVELRRDRNLGLVAVRERFACRTPTFIERTVASSN